MTRSFKDIGHLPPSLTCEDTSGDMTPGLSLDSSAVADLGQMGAKGLGLLNIRSDLPVAASAGSCGGRRSRWYSMGVDVLSRSLLSAVKGRTERVVDGPESAQGVRSRLAHILRFFALPDVTELTIFDNEDLEPDCAYAVYQSSPGGTEPIDETSSSTDEVAAFLVPRAMHASFPYLGGW